MQKRAINDHLITDYLLGASSETDTERLDEMSLTDSEFADRLRVMEDDLVDAYVRGELSGDSLSRFVSHYLASPLRHEKVKVAEAFLDFADRAASAAAVHTVASVSATPGQTVLSKPARLSFFAMPRLALQWGFAAAALLFFVAGGYLAYENLRLRQQMAQTQAERATLEQREQTLKRELDAHRSADADTEQVLIQVRERLAELEQQLPPGQPPKPKVVAFNLSPQTRGAGQIAAIAVPAGTDSVALKLDVEATRFPLYKAVLKNSGADQIIWRSGKLRTSGRGRVLRVPVPASFLRPQNYVLELSGVSAKGAVESVGGYPFRVVRP